MRGGARRGPEAAAAAPRTAAHATLVALAADESRPSIPPAPWPSRQGARRVNAGPSAARDAAHGRTEGWRAWAGPATVVLAFLAGLATDALSTGRQVNLLAAPMLGVIAWNLAVYLTLLARGIATASGRGAAAPGPIDRAMLRVGRLAGALSRPAPADIARASAVLHAASAALAAGLLAGLYLRGLAFEYRAGWESTFLDAPGVRLLLGLVLGPASALSGIALPDSDALASLRFGAGPGESAARWIHLYAITVALLVILPRTLLAIRSARSARRLGAAAPAAPAGAPGVGPHRIPADDAPLPRLSADPDGSIRVQALPYSFTPPEASRHGLEALLAHELGPGAVLAMAPSTSPDRAETGDLAGLVDPRARLVLALFSMSATPEPQTHAAFAAELRRSLARGAELRVLVDETAFLDRFGGAAQRAGERRAAWRAVFEDLGVAPRFAALGHPMKTAR